MSNILLALLFALLCFTQWQLSRQGTSLLCYLPTGLYLLIVGIASVRTSWTIPFPFRLRCCC